MPDLYRLTVEQLAALDGYAELSAARAVAAIEASKAQPFSRVLFGLNIPKIGWVLARNLAQHFGTIDALIAASQEALEETEGIGPDRAELVAEWFSEEENVALVRELEALGLTMRSGEAERPVEGSLTGRQYVITGTLERYTPRGGQGRARGARREGLGLRLEEDDRGYRRREPRLEGAEGAEGRRPDPRGGRSRGAPLSRLRRARRSSLRRAIARAR